MDISFQLWVNSKFSFVRNCQAVLQNAVPFFILPSVNENFCYSISLLAFGAVSDLDFDYSNRCVSGIILFYFAKP